MAIVENGESKTETSGKTREGGFFSFYGVSPLVHDSAKKAAKESHLKCFIKLMNSQHWMPTRYTLDVDLKDVVTVNALQT
ncbi:Ribosomal protein L27e [Corchorus olitorius]|uniref:Ribosomal protein L27e n=1 Tax=Corchorus olitorius TaxID=93759 RepID=A0A1R3K752_9ROSI|nr:Ribosomal protein L27e [Corchorus olitorius]